MRFTKRYGAKRARMAIFVGLMLSVSTIVSAVLSYAPPVFAESSSYDQRVNVTITQPQPAVEIVSITYSRDQNGVLHAKVQVRFHNDTLVRLVIDGREVGRRDVPYSNDWAFAEFDIVLPDANSHQLVVQGVNNNDLTTVDIATRVKHPGVSAPIAQLTSSQQPRQRSQNILLAETGRNFWLISGVAATLLVGSIFCIARMTRTRKRY